MKKYLPEQIIKKYSNSWVAISDKDNKVITHGNDILEVEKKLKKIGKKADVITFILPANHFYAP